MQTNLPLSATATNLELPENHLGRDFIVADMHGYRELLDQQLQAVMETRPGDPEAYARQGAVDVL